MDLYSPNPYWLLKNGIQSQYNSLKENLKTEVVVMGGGISGALAAWSLCNAGFNVLMVDKRHIGMGSTAASTSLLQYEIDVPLRELKNSVGEPNAVRSYQLCLDSIYDLQQICRGLHHETNFEMKPSLQYASFKKDVAGLRSEFEIRRKHGFEIDWLSEFDVERLYGIEAPGAVLSKRGGQVDAYKLTHALIKAAEKRGLKVFDRTDIAEITHPRGKVKLKSADGYSISAGHLIIACGYESQEYLPKKIELLNSTYAMVSKPVSDKKIWYRNSLIWETAKPYLYMRTTSDNRILVGGKDDKFYNPNRRDHELGSKTKQIEKSFRKLFPGIPFVMDFAWAGTFSSTKDGLPYIGQIRQHPNTYFALGFGGNGITFSVIAARQITDALLDKKNPDASIFSFNR